MQVIISASESILKTLGKPKPSMEAYRLMCYVVSQPVDGGVLIFHNLTGELILLTQEEYANASSLAQLREKWFLVPHSLSDKSYADRVKFVLKAVREKPKHITGYTIFTTTDCNARCFYCYEMGRSRIPMTNETARKAAKYIAQHCGGERVLLSWFGGEPLYNEKAIDIIATDLTELGVEFRSRMTSNGYLFSDKSVKKAVDLWKLRQVQITLDGTEAIYNRSKSYIYRDRNSPYQIVMGNITKLLNVGIRVIVRMNIDKHNAEDLLLLADELYERFRDKKIFSAYSHPLFEFSGEKKHIRTAEERRIVYEHHSLLTNRLTQYGLVEGIGLSQQLPINQCMADRGDSLTILPNGELGLCEHYSENHFVGNLDIDWLDTEVLEQFTETREVIAECSVCFFYPKCIRLKMCVETEECFPEKREEYLRKTHFAMQRAYSTWQKKTWNEKSM